MLTVSLHKFKILMEQAAIPPSYQKALHSHSAKSPKYGDISRWLTVAKWLAMSIAKGLGL